MLRTIIATVACAAFLTVVAAPSVQAADCKIAKDEKTEVGKACKDGGIKRAKAVMKAMVKAAKKADHKVDCDTCHANEEDWELTKDGKSKYKELLEKIGKKDEAAKF